MAREVVLSRHGELDTVAEIDDDGSGAALIVRSGCDQYGCGGLDREEARKLVEAMGFKVLDAEQVRALQEWAETARRAHVNGHYYGPSERIARERVALAVADSLREKGGK